MTCKKANELITLCGLGEIDGAELKDLHAHIDACEHCRREFACVQKMLNAIRSPMTPDLPDEKYRNRKWEDVPKDKYPYWMGLGVVYEHFHTAKSNRSPTTRRLVPEMYVEMHEEDAKDLGIKDGEKVRVVTRRGSLEARAQVGTNSLVKPARNSVPRGYMFGPWNLSVADSADPKKNKWLANGISSRVWDPVSGQADFKKLACRIEKV